MNENYIEKPEGKPVKTFRARVKVFGNDVVVVNPETPKGDMGRVIGANYSEIIKVFNSKTGKSKEPSYPTVEEIIDRV